jgi:hypothetical protein
MAPPSGVAVRIRMSRRLPLLLILLVAATRLTGAEAALAGRIEERTYVSPGGLFRVPIPVLPELGGTVADTPNVVTFADDFTTYISIASFPLDAAQMREEAARGRKDYLANFFATLVLPDFVQRFPGTKVENPRFLPTQNDGALLVYLILPGGSMFRDRGRFSLEPANNAVAKRGNLLFLRGDRVYVLSTELAERVLERTTYAKTPAEEDEILRQRLLNLLAKIEFRQPPTSR